MTEGRDPGAVRRRVAVGAGFTLIELLAAMTILLIIVMIVAQLFQQARVMWDTGSRRSDMNMKGRALADYMSQELSLAIRGPSHTFSASGPSATFYILGDATNGVQAARKVDYTYADGTVKRDGDAMCDEVKKVEFIEEPDPSGAANVLPLFVDVRVTVSDGGNPASNKVFESRAVMINRKRYSMD